MPVLGRRLAPELAQSNATIDYTSRLTDSSRRIISDRMSDLIFVGTVIAFFVVSALYVRFCDNL
jgi:hypothetical protein